MRVVSPSEVHVRVWERGTGETQACGTGATAAAVTAIMLGAVSGKGVTVHCNGGDLSVSYQSGKAVLEGPAKFGAPMTVNI